LKFFKKFFQGCFGAGKQGAGCVFGRTWGYQCGGSKRPPYGAEEDFGAVEDVKKTDRRGPICVAWGLPKFLSLNLGRTTVPTGVEEKWALHLYWQTRIPIHIGKPLRLLPAAKSTSP